MLFSPWTRTRVIGKGRFTDMREVSRPAAGAEECMTGLAGPDAEVEILFTVKHIR